MGGDGVHCAQSNQTRNPTMLIRSTPDLLPSEITPPGVYLRRREFIQAGAALAAAAGLAAAGLGSAPARAAAKLAGARKRAFSTSEETTPYKDITTYNNYYEFGTDKDEPSDNAHTLKTRPWTVGVEGEVRKARTFDIEELLKLAPLEDRIYRMRCVEGWSMVIPWIGYSM